MKAKSRRSFLLSAAAYLTLLSAAPASQAQVVEPGLERGSTQTADVVAAERWLDGDGLFAEAACDGADRTKGKGCPGGSEGKSSTCNDGIDNDGHGRVDCADTDCARSRSSR